MAREEAKKKVPKRAASGWARWRTTTRKQRSEAMRQVAEAHWQGTTAEERKEMAAHLKGARWVGTTAKERSEHARMMGKRSRGRWNPERCRCGKYTKERALKRNHKC
jgi:hypothetical protein